MEARKALKSGGRFLSDLFKGGSQSSSQQQHHHQGADEDDEEDGLASSTQAQSHAQALERFVTFVHGAMEAAPPANSKPPPSHQPTLSSSSLSMSASIDSSAASSDDEAEEEGEAEHEPHSSLLRPTFRSVPVHDLLRHADASLAAVERIAAYVEERWRLEARYVRDRSRLKLQLLQKEMAPADTLDALSEALALFGEVQSMQIGATVEEVDQQVRQPLLQLRDQLKGTVEKGWQQHQAMAKEIDGLEHRLTKSKAGLARLRDRAEELRARIEQYRRLVTARRSDGAGALWGDYPPDTPDPARVSGFVAMDEHQQRSPPSAEGQILSSLERRLAEVEGEMRASAREIEAQGRLLLDALGRQDRMRGRLAQALERADTLRRSGLQAAATAFVEAEARATQRSLFQLESLMQLAARVDAERDQQAFIARHRDGVGTAPRAPALRVLLDHQEWRGRLQRRHGGEEEEEEEEEGHWHDEVGMAAAPASPPASRDGRLSPRPLSGRAVEGAEEEEEENGEEVDSHIDSPTSSPDRTGGRGGRKERREEVVVPSFDEKEDGAVVAAFVQQLFAADGGTEASGAAAAAPSPEPAAATDRKGRLELREGYFDWDRFPTSTAESSSSSTAAAAAVGSFSFHSTATERARFFDRVLATEDGRGRAAFLAELNLQRSKKTNIGAGFEELAQLLWTFLLHAQRHRDVHGAKLGMMLASTFYRLRPVLPGTAAAAAADKETKREFLSRRLQDHPLWQDAAFWTRALQEQVREQLEEMGELLPFGAKAWHDAGPEARAEVVARIHNTCFSNAAALAHSMLEVGAPIEDARKFAVRVSEQYGLPEEAEHMLLQHLARREQRHSHQHHHHRSSKHEQRQPPPQQQQQQQQQQPQQPAMLPGQEGGHVTESSIG